MSVALSVARRTLAVSSVVPVAAVIALGSWSGVWLAVHSMGATEAYLGEVRHGCLLFAGALALSMAEPLQVGQDARSGLLRLRLVRGGDPALVARWAGLSLATLPLVAVAAVAAGGLPTHPLTLLVQLSVLAAGGLALGAFLDRGRLVPALWALLVLGHLRPWVMSASWGEWPVGAAAGWLLPALGHVDGSAGWVHGLLWSAGALLVARARLLAVAGG